MHEYGFFLEPSIDGQCRYVESLFSLCGFPSTIGERLKNEIQDCQKSRDDTVIAKIEFILNSIYWQK